MPGIPRDHACARRETCVLTLTHAALESSGRSRRPHFFGPCSAVPRPLPFSFPVIVMCVFKLRCAECSGHRHSCPTLARVRAVCSGSAPTPPRRGGRMADARRTPLARDTRAEADNKTERNTLTAPQRSNAAGPAATERRLGLESRARAVKRQTHTAVLVCVLSVCVCLVAVPLSVVGVSCRHRPSLAARSSLQRAGDRQTPTGAPPACDEWTDP